MRINVCYIFRERKKERERIKDIGKETEGDT